MYFYLVIGINKITNLKNNFKCNHVFQGLYNRKNTKVNKSLLPII